MTIHSFLQMWHKIFVLSTLSIAAALRLNPAKANAFSSHKSSLDSTTAAKPELGWDSHQAIDSIPETLVRTIDGNESMRRKFEELCRTSQVSSMYWMRIKSYPDC